MTDRIGLALVVAMGANRVIGREGALPWRIPSDLKRFKAVTLGKPVLMGRKTWQSLPRALPGRPNLIVSRTANLRPADAWVFSDLEAAIAAAAAMARRSGQDEICVIGGAELYAAVLDRAHRLYLSEVEASPPGDAWFPAFEERQFRQRARERVEPGPGDDHGFTWRVLERVSAAATAKQTD